MFKTYYRLTKPGIVYSNALTAATGYLLGTSNHHFILTALIAVLVGTSFVIGSACIINNYFDRHIDAVMARTKQRALVTGVISTKAAWTLAVVLFVLGFGLLLWKVNLMTAAVGLVGFIDYVVLYGIAKRKTAWGTLVGSVSGSASIVAGYTGAANRLDLGALLLFLVLAAWQMPHFYGIALYRQKDYAAAKIPVLPLIRGESTTKWRIVGYIVLFAAAVLALRLGGYIGWISCVCLLAVIAGWLYRGYQGWRTLTGEQWGRRMFLYSLIVILALPVLLAVGNRLP